MSAREIVDGFRARAVALPRARETWVDDVVRSIASTTTTTTTTGDVEAAYACAVLRGDFNACALGGGLRAAMTRGERAEGRFVVQADAAADDGARDGSTRTRCGTLSLTDGRDRFTAREYERIDGLGENEGWAAGMKIALTDPYVGKDGSIWLERARCAILGGRVDRLERARARAMAVLGAPNRPGDSEGARRKRALKAAWEDDVSRFERAEDGRDGCEPSAPRARAVVRSAAIVPDSLEMHSPAIVPATQMDAMDVDDGEALRASDETNASGVSRRSAPPSSLERDSAPASSGRGVPPDEHVLDVARHFNRTAMKGLWTYIAAMQAARSVGECEEATVHAWIAHTGKIEVQEEARPPLWRLKMQISDPTGVATVLLRNAQLESATGTTVSEYLAANEARKRDIETAARTRLETFCGRVKIGGLKGKHLFVLKLDTQPTTFKSSVADALRARAASTPSHIACVS